MSAIDDADGRLRLKDVKHRFLIDPRPLKDKAGLAA
jgi:hypothetical protein